MILVCVTDIEDRNYPNSTIGNTTPDTRNTEGGSTSTDKEEQGSNTGLVIGVVVALLAAIAVASIAAQYWISKNKNKIEPANIVTVRPNEPAVAAENKDSTEQNDVEKEDTTEQNDLDENNKPDLVEEDLTGT